MDSFDSLGIVDYNLHRRQHNPVIPGRLLVISDLLLVIPAQAGISKDPIPSQDPRLREDDGSESVGMTI